VQHGKAPVRAVLKHVQMSGKVEDLIVFQKATQLSTEISAIIERPSFQHHLRLRDQLGASSERIPSSIAEGSEQSTDRHYASYLYRARGSARELRTQLRVARDRGLIAESERAALDNRYEEVGKMLTGLIRHLQDDDWKNRR
jgi:four helix bundle protein